MANITLKNVPDHVYQSLKKQAVFHHRSLNSEAIVCLEQALQLNQPHQEDVLTVARKIREKTKKYKITEKKLRSLKDEGRE